MNGNKILTFLIVMFTLLSTLMVFNHLNLLSLVSAQPGVDEWGDASEDLVYGISYSNGQIKINTSTWVANGTFYLYYPNYWSVSPGVANNFSWDGPYEVEDYPVRVHATQAGVINSPILDTLNTGGNPIVFNRAGMWIFDVDTDPAHPAPLGYVWINTSTTYQIGPVTDVPYGPTTEVNIIVTEDGNKAPCMIAVLDPDGKTIYNEFTQGTATLDHEYFQGVGDYTVKAYRDLDKYAVYHYYSDENESAYDPFYGSNYSGTFPIGIAQGYDYAVVGPWDPPEKNATAVTFSIVDVLITDYIGDVCSVNFTTQETNIVTDHPDIEVDNLDIAYTTFTKQGMDALLSIQVVGCIEDRGQLINLYNGSWDDIDFVEYDIQVSTSEEDYTICYANQTCQLFYGNETYNLTSSCFSVCGNTLSIIIPLESPDEVYEDLSATSMFVKMNLSGGEPDFNSFVYLSDIAPNPPLELMEVDAPDNGSAGEILQFNASVMPLTGLPPYQYHWDFGDQGSSTLQNPTHIYLKAGVFTYLVTVTDSAGATASQSGSITIQGEIELIKAFLFGRFTQMSTDGDYILVQAVNLRMIPLKPLEHRHFIAGESLIFSNQYLGIIIDNHFIFGLFGVFVVPEPQQPQPLACIIDSTVNKIKAAIMDSHFT
jgi:hypothetical protein